MPAMRTEFPVPPFNTETKQAPPSAPFAEWKTWTYRQYYDECFSAARSFLALGLKRYDAVTIYGFNSPEWFMAQMAGMMAGGIAAGIYPSDTPEQVIYKARHSSAAVAVCEAKKAKIFEDAFRQGRLPKLKAIVTWGGDEKDAVDTKVECSTDNELKCLRTTWAKVTTDKSLIDQTPAATLEAAMACQSSSDVACYIYTSGTTGEPKAVMITHDNIVFESTCASSLLPAGFANTEERILSYLPLSHVAGCMVDIVMPVVCTANNPGSVVCGFARNYDLSQGTFGDRLRTLRPTIFLGVPRVWEKIAEKMKKVGASLSANQKKVSAYCKGKGLEHARSSMLGGTGEYPAGYSFAEALVLNKVKATLGLDQCKFAFTGAAPISVETLTYFGQLGLQINEVYGMSECTGATTWSSDEAHVWGSCGWAMDGTEVKVFTVDAKNINDKKECPRAKDLDHPLESEQGELCFRGRHIMKGYMANPDLGEDHVKQIQKKNMEAIDEEGWLHSGDKGCVGVNGMFRITGRYKELIIGSGGENIAPVPIEDNIKAICPQISNIMMIGDKQKYNVAIVTLKAKGASGELPGGDELIDDAATAVPGVSTISAASANKDYIALIDKAIRATNKNGAVCPSSASMIQKFSILPHDFSVETGELTPTLKLKRSHVFSAPEYSDIIKRLYLEGAGDYVPFKSTDSITLEVKSQ